MNDLATDPVESVSPSGPRSIGWLLFILGGLVSTAILLLSVFLWVRLANEQVLIDDMTEVINSVSNETVATTEGFLVSAERSAGEIAFLYEDGYLYDDGIPIPEFFYDVLRVNDEFDAIFLGGADGSFVYVSRDGDDGYSVKDIAVDPVAGRQVVNSRYTSDHELLEAEDAPFDSYDPTTRPWFQQARAAGDSSGVWTAPYKFFTSMRPGVTRALAARHPMTGEQVVIGIDIRLDELSTFMADRRASTNGVSFILDRSLKIVAYPEQDEFVDVAGLPTSADVDEPTVGHVAALVEEAGGAALLDTQGSIILDDVGYHFVARSLENNADWTVAVTAPDDDFLARTRGDQERTRVISLLGGLATLGLLIVGGMVINSRYRKERDFAERALDAAVHRAEERDVAQAKLSRTVSHLARSNAELEQYAYATAHDLRTPLRAMGGYAELILRELEEPDHDNDEVAEYANNIVGAYEQMCSTMDDLLDHARASVHEPVKHSVELSPIVQEVLASFRRDFEYHEVDVIVGDLPFAAVHPVAMRRVFQNLVSNAVKYRDPNRQLCITIAGERDGPTSVVHMSDNGIGIAEANRDAVFHLFNRLSTDDGGSGVGLAVVKKLVEEHRGSIDLDSTLGEGSTFTLRLPAEPEVDHEELIDA